MKKVLILSLLLSIAAGALMLGGCSFKSADNGVKEAFQLIKTGDYEKAMAKLETAEKNGEDAELVLRGKGIASMGLSDYEAAVKYLEDALSESDGRITDLEYDISEYLAVAQYRNGDKEGAVDTCNAILNLDDKKSDVYYLRGKAELGLGNKEDAITDFNAAVKADSKNPDLYINIYEALRSMGFEEEGNSYLKSAMELTTLNNYQKGRLYFWRGEYDSARDCLETAQKEGGQNEVILYLGRTYEALGDTSYAAQLYRNYIKENPGDAGICNQLGICEMTNGNYEEALEAFEQGIAANDNETMQSLKYNEIVAHEYLSNFKKAAVLMETYLKTYPDDDNAKRENAFLSTR
ncbi:tetratricopeptide repeat protein [Lachnospiraceae bacterium C1.1]|nr:tetratricopeptide repeat protein [Lachnospiraceae bacterium C1.1]